MKYSNWKINKYSSEAAQELEREGLSPIAALALASRSISAQQAAELIAQPSESQFHDPMLLSGMAEAVERIKQAVSQHEHIAVFGDYDVDGITSACMLQRYFTLLGLESELYIPDRIEDGYGLNRAAIDQLAQKGVTLIVTVDCGITAVDEVMYANSLNVDMIVTDHHECQGTLPCAVAVIDPKRSDCQYPNKNLAGVGVAFKLLCALEGNENLQKLLSSEYIALAAFGTIADVMPVTGENRTIIKLGVEKFGKSSTYPGLRCLLLEAGLYGKPLSCSSVGFTLAPRINAAGRMGKVMIAAELLLTQNEQRARALVQELCTLNRERQDLEAEMFERSLEMIGKDKPELPIVIAAEGWHQGVAGIVASRLCERFNLPTVVICLDGENGRGSCRSVDGFSIFTALESASELLEDFGGHELAAGLEIRRENIEALRSRLAEAYLACQVSESALMIDAELRTSEFLSLDSVMGLKKLEPFGRENEQPIFCILGAFVKAMTPIGGGKHVRFTFSFKGRVLDGVFFSKSLDHFDFKKGDRADLAFFPQINEFRGAKSVQLLLCAACNSQTREQDQQSVRELFEVGAELSENQARELCPERQEFIDIWRRIESAHQNGTLLCGEKQQLYSKLSELCGVPSARCCVCIRVFQELGLLDISESDSELKICLPKCRMKVELSSSKLLKSLTV